MKIYIDETNCDEAGSGLRFVVMEHMSSLYNDGLLYYDDIRIDEYNSDILSIARYIRL